MDLNYSEDQRLLKAAVDRFLEERYDFERRKGIIGSDRGWDPSIWADFAALGWLALPFSEESGGLGGGPVETALIMEAIGRALVVEPYLACVILAGGLIETLGTPQQKAQLLGGLMEGASRPALAHMERESGFDLARITSTAVVIDGGYRLSGEKTLVQGGPFADTFLVSALLDDVIRLFVVPADAPGLIRRIVRQVDGSRACDLTLTDVLVTETAVLGEADETLPALELAVDRVNAALAAEAVGIMDALLAATVAYTKQRVQFGKPLAAFQALQHRMGEMAVKCEEARASALLASLSLDAPKAMRIRGVSGARAKIGRVSRSVAQEAIQLHGAMGFSEEMPVGAGFRRLYAIENTFGTTADHLKRYGAVIGDPAILSGSLLREPA